MAQSQAGVPAHRPRPVTGWSRRSPRPPGDTCGHGVAWAVPPGAPPRPQREPFPQPRVAVPIPHGNNASPRTGSGSPVPIVSPTLRVPRRHFIEGRLDARGSRGQGPRSPLSRRGACPSQALRPLPVRWPCWLGRAPEVTGLQGQAARCGAGGMGGGGGRGHGQPQTKVAWCGLALGLAAPPGTGPRPGASGAGGLLAGSSTPGTLRPAPDAEPTTGSMSMSMLTGLPRPPPPVTERREAVVCLPQSPADTRTGPPLHRHWLREGVLHDPEASQRQAIADLGPVASGRTLQRANLSLGMDRPPAPAEPSASRTGRAPGRHTTQPGEGPGAVGMSSEREGRGWSPGCWQTRLGTGPGGAPSGHGHPGLLHPLSPSLSQASQGVSPARGCPAQHGPAEGVRDRSPHSSCPAACPKPRPLAPFFQMPSSARLPEPR